MLKGDDTDDEYDETGTDYSETDDEYDESEDEDSFSLSTSQTSKVAGRPELSTLFVFLR